MYNDDVILLLNQILEQQFIISNFLQFFVYGFIVVLIFYFGYWFFSRFFY